MYCPPGYIDGEDGEGNVIRGSWRNEAESVTGMTSIGRTSSNRYNTLLLLYIIINNIPRHSKSASETRTAFKDYFNSPVGEVSWQYRHVRRTN